MEPVKEMLRGTEEVKIFLLANPEKEYAMIDQNIIIYALIKTNKNRGSVCKRYREMAKADTTGSGKMGWIISPHGRLLG